MAKKETKKTKQHGIFVSFLKALLAFVTPVVLPLAVGFALGAFKVGGDKQVLLFSLIFSAVGIVVGIILAKVILGKAILAKKNAKQEAVKGTKKNGIFVKLLKALFALVIPVVLPLAVAFNAFAESPVARP